MRKTLESRVPTPAWDAIRGQGVAKRAIEVALVGSHSVMLYGPCAPTMRQLVQAGKGSKLIQCSQTCACGGFASLSQSCTCAPRFQYRWLRRLLRVAQDTDIVLEVQPAPAREILSNQPSGSWVEMMLRVQAAEQFAVRVGDSYLLAPGGAAERTLEMVVRRLQFDQVRASRLLRVSRSIASLGQSERLEAKHIAEAAQYMSFGNQFAQWMESVR